ncbi:MULTISPECIES: TadE/TadG family type IV pilus assembly protein [unclassified Microbacterium]|uniref:TadE/TadG family type IV pilus assembly protein n=1 Tax=unclassified Microbacterium TaxID=2609290 RepID=UPI0016569A6A|nr:MULTISPECIES: TadE/TadG family type IV pilus assembly protein [unclassified Microbacterium]MCT1365288.1 pilus assembly protein [Microbacterium sp. p3-SID131]MCT1376583.1 pilus assembly protein [Microbacterium sp. p3-SID337]CAD5140089.1 TadE family protein [Microbacterium sp. Nx66]
MRALAGVIDDRGSNPVEFVLVGTLLTALTLAVLQLAFAIYVRNVVHDAAVEGAYYAALADTTDKEGEERAREVIRRAVGPSYADDITVASARREGQETVEVRIRTTLPVFGLVGVPAALQVEASAPPESFDAR